MVRMPSPQVIQSSDGETPIILSDLEQKLQGIVPSDVRRPTDKVYKKFRSAPGTVKSSQQTRQSTLIPSESPLSGWVRIKHPDADVYYFHEEKILYTWSDVLDPKVHALVMEAAEMLRKSFPLQDKQDVNLVLDTHTVNEGDRICSYYYVSHGDRRIFWLEGMGHVEGSVPSNYLKGMEAQYW
ncbi:hypothetical protein PAXRUDRAFT_29307 [Paxillus rubicundulus Ve08.2h10]|uniref:Uncharacterized protein n=1 Tax=Paxillus rubicundulus Ve08.2h10 TaxID=930991 RepID=A0A0D0BLE0_9AGAM|nr:hypothetical protein PAXRUDRAFT_29307 [Paxillus rubicundulus Ve08.2h10]